MELLRTLIGQSSINNDVLGCLAKYLDTLCSFPDVITGLLDFLSISKLHRS